MSDYVDEVNKALREAGVVEVVNSTGYSEVSEGTPQHVLDELAAMTDADFDKIFKKSDKFIQSLNLTSVDEEEEEKSE